VADQMTGLKARVPFVSICCGPKWQPAGRKLERRGPAVEHSRALIGDSNRMSAHLLWYTFDKQMVQKHCRQHPGSCPGVWIHYSGHSAVAARTAAFSEIGFRALPFSSPSKPLRETPTGFPQPAAGKGGYTGTLLKERARNSSTALLGGRGPTGFSRTGQ
jgi:hypothetical protein